MRLIRVTRFGPPEVLTPGEAPDPVAGPGEALVRVAVADTLHLDTVIRRGAFPSSVVTPPYVPGGGIAGEVVDGEPGLIGQRAVARTGSAAPADGGETIAQLAARDTHTGGYGEYAVLPTSRLIPIPAGLGFLDAAALVNDGMTALLLTETARPRTAEWALVTPAGGGVGSLLVQLLHQAGTRVIAAARGEHKLAVARELGADATIDYRADDWTDHVLDHTGGRGADLVLDGVGGELGRRCLDLTAPGGRFIGYGAPSGEFTRDRNAISLLDLTMTADDERRFTETALIAALEGRLKPVVGLTVPLDRAAEAHAAIEARAVVGKTLLLAR